MRAIATGLSRSATIHPGEASVLTARSVSVRDDAVQVLTDSETADGRGKVGRLHEGFVIPADNTVFVARGDVDVSRAAPRAGEVHAG